MENSPLARKLLNIATLNPEEQSRLDALLSDISSVARRHDIISEGDRPERVHVIVEGWAARYKILPEGGRQILAFLLPGDFCDVHATMLAEIDHGIFALTDCKVAAGSAEALDRLIIDEPRIARAMWWAALIDESVSRSWIANQRRDARARIAHLFCELHTRMEIAGLASGRKADVPLTQEEVGDAIGLTPIHVNRTLQQLRSEGVVEFRGRTLTIIDSRKLSKIAGFSTNYLHRSRRLS